MGECLYDLDNIESAIDRSPAEAYGSAVDRVGARTQQSRGTGTKTTMIAMLLAWLYKDQPPESALITAANFLGSDTDTIGTMAGAMLGAVARTEPQFEIQDRSYISAEASRLFRIATKQSASSFEYPEVMNWRAPRVSADVVVKYRDKLALSGLGVAEATSQVWQARKHDGTGWQWLKLHFGQTVLAKRRADLSSQEDPSEKDSRLLQAKPLDAQTAKQHALFSQRDNRRGDSNQSSIRTERAPQSRIHLMN